MYVTSVKRDRDALDAVRGEMASYILKLRAALGKDAPGTLFAERNDKYVFGSLETPARDKLKKWEGWTTKGNEKVISNLLAQASAKGAKIPAKLRAQAAEKIVCLCTYTLCIRLEALGHRAEAEPYYRRLLPLIQGQHELRLEVRRGAHLREVPRRGRRPEGGEGALRGGRGRPKTKPVSLFAAKALATFLVEPSKDEQAAKGVHDAAYTELKDKPDKKAPDAGLQIVAKAVGGDGTEAMIRGLAAFCASVYTKRPPKKTATVRYSARLITGLDSFAAAEKLCDSQRMDRPFGGATDMLDTDVATGSRAGDRQGQNRPREGAEAGRPLRRVGCSRAARRADRGRAQDRGGACRRRLA